MTREQGIPLMELIQVSFLGRKLWRWKGKIYSILSIFISGNNVKYNMNRYWIFLNYLFCIYWNYNEFPPLICCHKCHYSYLILYHLSFFEIKPTRMSFLFLITRITEYCLLVFYFIFFPVMLINEIELLFSLNFAFGWYQVLLAW